MLPNNDNDPPTISSNSLKTRRRSSSGGGMFMDLLLDNCDVSSPLPSAKTNRFSATTTTSFTSASQMKGFSNEGIGEAQQRQQNAQEEEEEEAELVDLMTDLSMSSISLDDDDTLMHDHDHDEYRAHHHQRESFLSSLIPPQPPTLFNRKQQNFEWDENFSLLIRLKTTRLATIVEEDKSPMFATTTTTAIAI